MATGDYEGRILIWRLSTGAKCMGLFHRAERYEAAVDKLAWLPTKDARDDNEVLLLLSAGGDGIVRVWNISQQPQLITTIDGAHGRLEQAAHVSSGCFCKGLVGVCTEKRTRACGDGGHCWTCPGLGCVERD